MDFFEKIESKGKLAVFLFEMAVAFVMVVVFGIVFFSC